MNKLLKKIYNKKIRYFLYPFLFIVICYLLAIIFADKIQTYLLFPSLKTEKQAENTKILAPFLFEEINIPLGEKENIQGLFIDNKSEKTIFYFQGNGGNLNYYFDDLKTIKNLGYNIIAFNYPGFGGSSSFPNRDNIKKYSESFYSFVKKEKNISDNQVSIIAYSIGTGIALDFSQSHKWEKIILIAPLSSLFDMSLKEYNFILQKYLFLSDLFNNKEIIKTIHSPLLIIHGNKDTLIPFAQGKIVYNNSKSKKSYFLEMNNVGHNSLLQKYEKTMLGFLKVFLEKGELEKKYFFIDENTKIPEIKKEEKKIVPLENLKKLDYINDTSLTKYVGYGKSFEEINYIPLKLKKIRGNYIKDIKGGQLLREEALIALDEMGKDFYKIFSTKISIVSGYRSYFYQSQIKSGTCPDNLCSKPGYSEHQSGLAIDLWETTTEKDFLSKKELNSYFLRLKENAHRYGFHNSYQNGVEIDGYDKEPWHWRYLGKDLASYLYKEKISFSQFYKKLNTKESKE